MFLAARWHWIRTATLILIHHKSIVRFYWHVYLKEAAQGWWSSLPQGCMMYWLFQHIASWYSRRYGVVVRTWKFRRLSLIFHPATVRTSAVAMTMTINESLLLISCVYSPPWLLRYFFSTGSDRYKQVLALSRECLGKLVYREIAHLPTTTHLRGFPPPIIAVAKNRVAAQVYEWIREAWRRWIYRNFYSRKSLILEYFSPWNSARASLSRSHYPRFRTVVYT